LTEAGLAGLAARGGDHGRRRVDAQDLGRGITFLQDRQVRPAAATGVQHAQRIDLDQLQALVHAAGDLAPQEIGVRHARRVGKHGADSIQVNRSA
jgi:hypothetical protein